MRVLLDTHAILWWYAGDPRLSAYAREVISANSTEVFVSAASVWEVSTKARIGKLSGVERLLTDFDALIKDDGFRHLPVTHQHALLAGRFASPRRDPFDRMLAAQAMIEDAVLLSNDHELKSFGVRLAW
jgi:PIN domain nuclease of toxin-antitoxin system